MAYIDGFNLYFGLRSKGWRSLYWLNVRLLAENLLKPNQSLAGVKYFTARIRSKPGNPDKQKRQNVFLEAVATLPDTSIFYGHYLSKTRRCRSCGAIWEVHEEKMTDVNIAVEMLRDAYDDTFDTALLVSADSDLTRPIEAIRDRCPDKRVVLVLPPNRQSKQLESVAHTSFRIGRKKLKDSQFPDRVLKPDGFTLSRPRKWT